MPREIEATYVLPEQREQWAEEAEEMGMSKSEWIQAMVEAGRKDFSRDVQPDETRDDLRRKRNDLRDELQRARERIEALEEQVHTSEREAVLSFLEDNPGTTAENVVQHIANTARPRTMKLLAAMEGEEFERGDDGGLYRI